MGYSSRILAESWESNNLYYAALADEAAVPVQQLDALRARVESKRNRKHLRHSFGGLAGHCCARCIRLVSEVRQHQNAPVAIARSENRIIL